MFSHHVASIQSSIINSIQTELEARWLEVKDYLIERETEKLVKARNAEYENEYKIACREYERSLREYERNTSSFNNIFNNNYGGGNYGYGNSYNNHYSRPVRPREPVKESVEHWERSSFRSGVINQYKQKFAELWDAKLSKTFNQQFNKFQPEQIFEQINKRHPWIGTEAAVSYGSDSMAYQFVFKYLSKRMLSLTSPQLRSWQYATELQLDNSSFSWNALDQVELKKRIEGYPFAKVQKHYVESRRSGVTNVVNRYNDADYERTRVPGRVDIFRLLANDYEMKPADCEGIKCTQIAPLLADELVHISKPQLNHIQTLLLNLETEEKPYWIALQKTGTVWQTYVPKTISVEQKTALNLKFRFPTTFIEVEDKDNVALNNIEGIQDNVRWHAILFGRVLPAIRSGKDLSTFRDKAPLPVLLQNVLENISSVSFSKTVKEDITKSFNLRKPFSNYAIAKNVSKSSMRQLLTPSHRDAILASSVLNSFDQGILEISKDLQTIAVKSNDADHIFKGMTIVYHNKINTIILPHSPDWSETYSDSWAVEIFKYDTHLRSIQLTIKSNSELPVFAYPMQCAARNRFLEKVAPVALEKAENDCDSRKKLWSVTGEQLTRFFLNQGKNINSIEFMDSAVAFNQKWRPMQCSHKMQEEAKAENLWEFAQITQMGATGLQVLFNQIQSQFIAKWDAKYKETAPKLDFTFDCQGALTDKPNEYLAALVSQIGVYDSQNRNKGCAPLFNSLSLILPSPLTVENIAHLMNLMNVLNNRWKANQEEIREVTLHNVNKQDPLLDHLFQSWSKVNSPRDPQYIQIRIPTWDRESSVNQTECTAKAKYRATQNKILDNHRLYVQPQLLLNVRGINDAAANRLDPNVLIEEQLASLPQTWEGDNVFYPLTLNTPGIQQQLQQQVEQEFQQEQEQEQEIEQEYEQDAQILQYGHKEDNLITRNNINMNCRKLWQAIPDSMKNMSGLKQDDLRHLFSMWVGSNENADLVIEKMEMTAVEELMKNANLFRMGITKDNLPAGFHLAYSRDNTLILCFDAHKKIDDLKLRSQLPVKQRNPFTVETHIAKEASVFKGDYRQFAPLNNDSTNAQTLWRFLATEDNDKLRIDNAKNGYSRVPNNLQTNLQDNEASVVMQRYDVNSKIVKPNDFENCLVVIKQYAAKQQMSADLQNLLFEKGSPAVMTESNVKAFGQLFDNYDPQEAKSTGTTNFFFLAQQIYNTFGREHFIVWKKRVLDVSQNWSELLDKAELDAVAMSIATLKKHPVLQAVWWKLIDGHGRSTGHLLYSRMWPAFQKIIGYIDDNYLQFDKNAIARLVDKTENFNMKVFLDRLQRVLKLTSKQLDAMAVQQSLLDNADQIDWRHNGFYYASRYQNYPYWKDSLKLSEFAKTAESKELGYVHSWYEDADLLDPKAHALRLASHKAQLTLADFNRFEALVSEFPEEKSGNNLRILTACILQGVDKLDKCDPKKVYAVPANLSQELVVWLNKFINFAELTPNTLQMRYTDIPLFFSTISKLNLKSVLESMTTNAAFTFYNTCGRALQCFQGPDRQEKFYKLLEFAKKQNDFSGKLIKYYPWLIDDAETIENGDAFKLAFGEGKSLTSIHEADMLHDQLRSIDFDRSTYLPTMPEIIQAYKSTMDDSAEFAGANNRRQTISTWIQKGCAVTLQDARFRKVDEIELKFAEKFMSSHLRVNYKNLNLPLFKTLIQDHLAVDSESNGEHQLDKLMRVFARIDNKTHYNELGQVLGKLISTAKAGGTRYYSVPQLKSWLDALIDDQNYHKTHYPVSILNEVMTFNIGQDDSSLVSSDLNKLSPLSPIGAVSDIQRIARLELSNLYKPMLAKLRMHNPANPYFVRLAETSLVNLTKANVDSSWLKAACKLFVFLQKVPNKEQEIAINSLCNNMLINSRNGLSKLWQDTQTKLINCLVNGKISLETLKLYFNPGYVDNAYIKIIMAQAIDDNVTVDTVKIAKIYNSLQNWRSEQLEALAQYYASRPKPSVDTLIKLLGGVRNDAASLIHAFETVEQGLKEDGKSQKRHYSITEDDNTNLNRVLKGIKRKGQDTITDAEQHRLLNLLYYVNSYSQVAKLKELAMSDLSNLLQQALKDVKAAADKDEKAYATARLLACMREITLRKTGMWANHTQMLTLIYAALYNDESLLYQVRTGQGKSIISTMRNCYLALMGNTVDLFSSKDSLSYRDHDDFYPVMDAMGIAHSYITSSSPANAYKDVQRNGIGAINFSTLGNFSLFISTHNWQTQTRFNLENKKRIAFLDECDHILLDENTQFNYSDGENSDAIYNVDEWVYRIAYDYYLEKVKFSDVDADGVLSVSRRPHMEELCKRLQDQAKFSPKQSTFFQKYIIPALSNSPESLQLRDQQLKQLLTAAHAAEQLKEGLNFCVAADSRPVSGGMIIHTRFAKVMINSQVCDGSTYSDLVQQFLHVRLNKAASLKGETPDFFVEPSSQIVLSQNAKYILKTYYGKIEGCSGTAGSSQALAHYQSTYNINHVVKIPTHEPMRLQYEKTLYCDSSEAHIKAIADDMRAQAAVRPLLATCEDDIEVKRIAKLLQKELSAKESKESKTDFDFSRFVADTNDTGKKEREIVPIAGEVGAQIISSRMGRGTDIKPKTEKGLKVGRTYPDKPEIIKQEKGRAGRNGAQGFYQDIIDYSQVLKKYKRLLITHPDRFNELLTKQTAHLDKKIAKHKLRKSTKFDHLDKGCEDRDKYLITRCVVFLNYELKAESEQYLRRKEFLIAALSGNVMTANNNNASKALQKDWIGCRKAIEAEWSIRLANEKGESDKVYDAFSAKVENIWKKLCTKYPYQLTADLIKSIKYPEVKPILVQKPVAAVAPKPLPAQALEVKSEEKEAKDAKAAEVVVHGMPAMIGLYQDWVRGADIAYFSQNPIGPQLIDSIYGESKYQDAKYNDMKSLFKTLRNLNDKDKYSLFAWFRQLTKQNSFYSISCRGVSNLITHFAEKSKLADEQDYLKALTHLFKQAPFTKQINQYVPDDIEKNSRLALLIGKILTTFVHKDNNTLKFIADFTDVLYRNFWENFDDRFVTELEAVFAADPKVTSMLTSLTNYADLHYFVDLIYKNVGTLQSHARREQIKTYLLNNGEEVMTVPGIMRPIVELALATSPLNMPQNHLPDAKSIAEWPAETQNQIWHFFTQRMPFNEDQYREFVSILPQEKTAENFARYFKPMLELPAHISIAYIKQQLNFLPGRFHLNDADSKLANLKQAGIAFNAFLLTRGLIKGHYPASINHVGELDAWKNEFNRLTVEQNQVFFKWAQQFPTIPMATLHRIVTALHTNKLDITQLEHVLKMANNFSVIEQVKRDQIYQMLNQIFDTSQAANVLNARIEKVATSTQLIMQNPDYLALNQETTDALLRGYCLNDSIFNPMQLNEALQVAQMASQLHAKGNYADYFATIDCPNKSQRQLIMQYLQHGLINLGQAFDDRCNDEYKNLAIRIGKPQNNLSILKPEVQGSLWRRCYLSVAKLMQEIAQIASHPFVNINNNRNNSPQFNLNRNVGDKDYQSYFDGQKAKYSRYWFVNRDRKDQAKTMFSTLASESSDQFSILKTICLTQNRLLQSDRNTRRNGKGYSRLLNITIEMFATIASEYIANRNIEPDVKLPLKSLIDQQLKSTLHYLVERLPSKLRLKAQLQGFAVGELKYGSSEMAELTQLLKIANEERKTIPKTLHYLLDSLESFVEMSNNMNVNFSERLRA